MSGFPISPKGLQSWYDGNTEQGGSAGWGWPQEWGKESLLPQWVAPVGEFQGLSLLDELRKVSFDLIYRVPLPLWVYLGLSFAG